MSDYFGLSSGNTTEDPGYKNYINGMRFQNNVGNGTLTKVEMYFVDTTPSGNVRLGVYADSGGDPGALLLDAGAVVVANGWVVIDSLSLPVTSGTYYWLAFVLSSNPGCRYQTGQAAGSHAWRNQSYGALPEDFGEPDDTNNTQYVMRAYVETATGENKVASDSGGGGDNQESFLAAVTKGDSGGGNDATNAALAGMNREDGGGGMETSATKVDIDVSDAGGSADERQSFLASLARADSSIGAEQSLLSLLLSSFESGAGIEALISLIAGLMKTESGSGEEHISGRNVILGESGSGTDTPVFLLAVIMKGETGSGVEQSLLTSFVLKLAAEAGSAADTAGLIAALDAIENGLGADVGWLVGLKNILGGDLGAGLDELKALIESSKTGTDMKLPGRAGQVRIPSRGVSL